MHESLRERVAKQLIEDSGKAPDSRDVIVETQPWDNPVALLVEGLPQPVAFVSCDGDVRLSEVRQVIAARLPALGTWFFMRAGVVVPAAKEKVHRLWWLFPRMQSIPMVALQEVVPAVECCEADA